MRVLDRVTQLAVSRRSVLAMLVAIVGHAWFGARWALGRSGSLPKEEKDNPVDKEHEMPHENTANWAGEVESASYAYMIDWKATFHNQTPPELGAEFTIRHGMRGRHVAKALEMAWNDETEKREKALAVAEGMEIDFAGEVAKMVFRVKDISTPNNPYGPRR